MRARNFYAVAVVALATGCASHPQPIAFSDAADISTQSAQAAASASQPHLAPADETTIEQMVFSYLLERQFPESHDYSAVFLQTDDAQVAAMQQRCPHHIPPIKDGSHALIEAHRTPIDQDTKQPALVFSAEVFEPNADGTVDALGRWSGGDAVKGEHAFRFQKSEAGWQILEIK